MIRLSAFVCSVLLCFGLFGLANAQTKSNETLLRALLDLPAPPPVKNARANFKARSEEFYFKKNQPPDDAPLEDLLDYWARHQNEAWRIGAIKPSAAVLQRLMNAAFDDPTRLSRFINFLDNKPESVAFVRRLLAEQNDRIGDDERAAAQSWLRYHSADNVNELLQAAQKTKDRKNGAVRSESELGALAAVDWEAARPIIERLANDPAQINSAIYAKRLQYERALKTDDSSEVERLRRELQATVENKNLTARARDTAMDALFLNDDWQGREDWYVSLLADPTLFKLEDASGSFTGLTTPMLVAPEKWKATMIKLVGNQNRTVHNAAVRNLNTLSGAEADEAAMRALLPWLTDPKWADDAGRERQEFIQSLARVNLPESVPGLIQVLTNESDAAQRAAVIALTKYKDSRAVPALRVALEKEPSQYNRNVYIAALVACNGFSDDEQVAALEAFAQFASQAEEARDKAMKRYQQALAENPSVKNFEELDAGTREALMREMAAARTQVQESETIAVSIGKYLSEQTEAGDTLTIRLLERIDALERTNPPLAAALDKIARKWQSGNVDAWTLRRVKAGKADVDAILSVLARREKVRERTSDEFGILLGANGAAGALGTILLGDAAEMSRVLARAEDAEARIALLAAARLVRAPLPIDAVAALLDDKNKLLALAAERYLESEDSQAARLAVYAKHPNQALILGARDAFNPLKAPVASEALNELFLSVSGTSFYGQNYEQMQKTEDALRKELLENKDLKTVYAFLTDDEIGHRIVRVYADKAVFRVYDDLARYSERVLTKDELQALQAAYTTEVADSAPTLRVCDSHHSSGCDVQSFVALNQSGGRRTFAQNYSLRYSPQDVAPLDELNKLFAEFAAAKMIVRYKLSDKIPNLEIVFADRNAAAKAVWKNGEDLRVLIERKTADADNSADAPEIQMFDEDEDYEELTEKQQDELRRREQRLEFEREQTEKYGDLAWHKIEQNNLGETTAQPPGASFLPDATKVAETPEFDFTEPSWQVRAGSDEIRSSSEAFGGLWRLSRTRAAQKIKNGEYGFLLVTPDGKWLITSKQKSETDETQSLVRINLTTNKETIINLPATTGTLYPVAFVAAHNKVLVARGKSADNPNEFYLVAPETGAVAPVKGDFRPLDEQDFRPLQTARDTPNALWVAVYDEKTKTTGFGLYDTAKFAFRPLLKLPGIKFKSIDAWVDEAEKRLYFVYNGQLLAVPLPNAAN